jgi:signal transduction histidine kinase
LDLVTTTRPTVRTRLAAILGVEDEWARERPALARRDVWLAGWVEVLGLLSLELVRSVGVLDKVSAPVWTQWLAVSTGSALLLGRRRWPLVVAGVAALHMFVVGVTMPVVMGQVTLQFVYFLAIFSAVAWARDRRLMVGVIGFILLFMFGWLVWQFAVGSGIQQILDRTQDVERTGLFAPVPAGVALSVLINVIYFGGAVIGGAFAWRAARARAQLEVQAETIAAQAEGLRHRAVVDERLRIARELHDVVGHHVSVIGIQAAAARRLLDRDPATAADALGRIEHSSREAVRQMRGLLGTLRALEVDPSGTSEPPDRSPEPGVADLPTLAEERTSAGMPTSYSLVESTPGAAGRLAPPVGLSLYRIAQEALANVSRHSTAPAANVTLRVDEGAAHPHAEIEILDDGRPRHGTLGSGLGQLGIRERAASHRGEVEIGPRATGGYRVRVRIPLGDR